MPPTLGSHHAQSGNAVLLCSAIYCLSPAISTGISDRYPSKLPQLLYCAHGCKNKRILVFCNCFSGHLCAVDIVKNSLLPNLNPSEIAPQDLFGLLHFVFTAKLPKFITLPMFFFMHDILGGASFPLSIPHPLPHHPGLLWCALGLNRRDSTCQASPAGSGHSPPSPCEDVIFFFLLFPFFFFHFSKLNRATAACLTLGNKTLFWHLKLQS